LTFVGRKVCLIWVSDYIFLPLLSRTHLLLSDLNVFELSVFAIYTYTHRSTQWAFLNSTSKNPKKNNCKHARKKIRELIFCNITYALKEQRLKPQTGCTDDNMHKPGLKFCNITHALKSQCVNPQMVCTDEDMHKHDLIILQRHVCFKRSMRNSHMGCAPTKTCTSMNWNFDKPQTGCIDEE
jgi:hypothetical protein